MDQEYLLNKYKLGKRPHVLDERDLMLGKYLAPDEIPNPPEEFTSSGVVDPGDWGMLRNDELGDCVPAGVSHMQLVLGRQGGHHPEFGDASVTRSYEEMGGYVPGQAETDQGCDMRYAAKVWHKSGVFDVEGARHRCGAYLWVQPGNLAELWAATYLFDGAVLGYELPRNAMEAFDQDHFIWDFEAGSPSIGGHCVPGFGRVSQQGLVVFDSVSWGHQVGVTGPFIENHMDSGFAPVSASVIRADTGTDVKGFDMEQLHHDLDALGAKYA